ncbi:unnamed protein product [Sympodiomycopsis kandeliae]
MGKGGRNFAKAKRSAEGRKSGRGGGRLGNATLNRQARQNNNNTDGGWASSSIRDNDRFEGYYLDQKILPAEEWKDFLQAFRDPLPTTFRFTAGKATTRQLINQMREKFIPELSGLEFEGQPVPPPKQLEWYPDGLAWQIDVMKNVLRKQPDFQNFQRFLVTETEVGSISRQEAVSMIPPLFLDVRPEHLVLDMCAAPGSKTAQLIEALHSPTTSSPDHYDPCPPGLIMANDSDQKRAYMLVHQAQRLPSPNLCVTNVDASAWPKVQVPWKSDKEDAPIQARELKFDRVLGDVPCSGDGTLRKNVGIWKDWTLQNGQGLHAIQLRILLRGLNALRPGGRMVYSTCSLNPLENEAVIAAALRECGADPANGKNGSVRVVDVSDQLPQLKRAKGLTTWKVAPGKGKHLFDGSPDNLRPKQAAAQGEAKEENADEIDEDALANAAAAEAQPTPEPGTAEYRAKQAAIPWVDSWDRLKELDAALASRTAKTLWPSGDEAALGLEHCMRVYPHYQNTGGFFITVLEKKGNVDNESQSAGIQRAVKALDEGSASAPQYAGLGGKRALSPEAEQTAEEGGAKRVKTDEGSTEADAKPEAAAEATAEEVADAEAEDEMVPEAPTTHVKPDNHAADRKAKQRSQQSRTDSGFGLPGGVPFKEDPFTYVSTDNPESLSVHNFFKFEPEFPSRNLLVRNSDGLPLRTIYLTSTTVRALIQGGGPGVERHRTMNPLKLRLLNAGVKAFARQDTNKSGELPCKWRIVSDGLAPIRAYLKDESIISGTLSDVAFLLSEYYPTIESLPESPFKTAVTNTKLGSHVMSVQPSTHESSELKETIDIPLWRAAMSVNLMLDKADRTAMSNRIFGKDLSINAKKNAEQLKNRKATQDEDVKAKPEEDATVQEEKKEEKRAIEVEVREEFGEQESSES